MRLFAHILLFSRSVRRDPKALLKVFSFRAWRRLLTPKKESKEQLRKAPFYSEVWTPYEQLLQRRYDVMEESSWPTEILARMPPLRGEIPEPIPEDLVVFVGCDHQYFILHAVPLAYSIEYNAPRVRLHFHVFNPERNFDKIITFLRQDLRNIQITATFEEVDLDDRDKEAQRTYYASARFIRLFQLMEAAPAYYLSLDADSLVRKPLAVFREALGNRDIMLLWRKEETHPCHKVLAGVLMLSPTKPAMDFMLQVAVLIADQLLLRQPMWYIDQVIIGLVVERFERQPGRLTLATLPRELRDFEFGDGSVVWVGKGPRKHEAEAYVQLRKQYWKLFDNQAHRLGLVVEPGDGGPSSEAAS